MRLRAATARLTALCLVAYARSALADASESERLFAEGRALMLERRFDEACPKIAESQRLEPHVGTLLNLAACHESQGKIGSAWVEYQKALTAARTEGQVDRARLAEQRIAAIEPRVPWVRLSLRTSRADLVVTLDGGELAPVALGKEMPVDPGEHVASATVNGERVFEEHVELREGERRTVLVELTEPSGVGEPTPPTPKLVVDATPSTKPDAEKSHWVLEPGVYVAFAGGSANRPRPKNEASVALESSATGERTSCAEQRCDYGAAAVPGMGSAGLNLFGGYRFGDTFRVGIRMIAGPMLAGGSLWAVGPSVALRATSALTFGVFVAFGDATISGYAQVTPPRGYGPASSGVNPAVSGQLAGGGGVGAEISLRLTTLGRGDLLATATPFFLDGSQGTLFALPFGVAYRFE